jgi:hypothetical protein
MHQSRASLGGRFTATEDHDACDLRSCSPPPGCSLECLCLPNAPRGQSFGAMCSSSWSREPPRASVNFATMKNPGVGTTPRSSRRMVSTEMSASRANCSCVHRAATLKSANARPNWRPRTSTGSVAGMRGTKHDSGLKIPGEQYWDVPPSIVILGNHGCSSRMWSSRARVAWAA